MSISISEAKRLFFFNSVPLPDPGCEFTVEEVRDIYSAQYPDISTALIDGPDITEDGVTYKFIRNVGTKG